MKKITYVYIICIAFYAISCQSSANDNNSTPEFSYQPLTREKTTAELKEELKQKEQEDFAKHLDVNATMRENLIGEKVIEGFLFNNSTVSAFKDITVKIIFLSKTETELNTQNQIIYEVLSPGDKVKFKIKTYAPDAAEKFSIRIVDVTPL